MKKFSIFLLIMTFVVSCAQKIEFAPKVSLLAGDIKINGKTAETGMSVSFGDKIETGDKSFCEIKINSKSILRLGMKTELVFRVSETENNLDLKKGWLSGVTRKKFTKQGQYFIKSNSVVASVRGTSFCIKAEASDKVYFCVCNGSIDLAGSEGEQRESVSAQHHAARRFIRKNDGTIDIDKNPGLLYHNDENVEVLARSIDEKIDWTAADSH